MSRRITSTSTNSVSHLNDSSSPGAPHYTSIFFDKKKKSPYQLMTSSTLSQFCIKFWTKVFFLRCGKNSFFLNFQPYPSLCTHFALFVPILWVLAIPIHIRYHFVNYNMRSLLGQFLSLRIWGSQKSKIAPKVTSYYSIQKDIGYVQILPKLIELVRTGQNGYIYKGVAKSWENMSFSHIAKKGGQKRGGPFFFRGE